MNVFSYVGIVMMVVGAGCGVGGFFFGFIGRITLWSMAFTFLLMGVIFFFTGKGVGGFNIGTPSYAKPGGGGLPGQATVTSMWDTGVTIGGIAAGGAPSAMFGFQLQVQLPGRNPYMAETKERVPRMFVGAIQPGSVVAVHADPADPSKVHIDWSVAPRPAGMAAAGMAATPVPGMVAPVPAAPMAAPPVSGHSSAAELLATGQRGWATVSMFQPMGTPRSLGITPSNPAYLDDPIYQFVVQVQLDGQQPFQAQMGHRVPRHLEPTLQQGMTVQVAVDPANPTQNVAIDWGDG
jgi:hypothetical protein